MKFLTYEILLRNEFFGEIQYLSFMKQQQKHFHKSAKNMQRKQL